MCIWKYAGWRVQRRGRSRLSALRDLCASCAWKILNTCISLIYVHSIISYGSTLNKLRSPELHLLLSFGFAATTLSVSSPALVVGRSPNNPPVLLLRLVNGRWLRCGRACRDQRWDSGDGDEGEESMVLWRAVLPADSGVVKGNPPEVAGRVGVVGNGGI